MFLRSRYILYIYIYYGTDLHSICNSKISESLGHTPGGVVVLLVDADGLPPAVPLVVVEQPAVLGARHVVVPVGLGGGSCGGKECGEESLGKGKRWRSRSGLGWVGWGGGRVSRSPFGAQVRFHPGSSIDSFLWGGASRWPRSARIIDWNRGEALTVHLHPVGPQRCHRLRRHTKAPKLSNTTKMQLWSQKLF